MKVRFYVDLPPGMTTAHLERFALFASTKPTSNLTYGTRVAFDVDFPSALIREFDVQAPGTAVKIIESKAA